MATLKGASKSKGVLAPKKTPSYNPFGGGNLLGNVKLPAVAPLPKVNNLLSPAVSKQVTSGGFSTIPGPYSAVTGKLLNPVVAKQVSSGGFRSSDSSASLTALTPGQFGGA